MMHLKYYFVGCVIVCALLLVVWSFLVWGRVVLFEVISRSKRKQHHLLNMKTTPDVELDSGNAL